MPGGTGDGGRTPENMVRGPRDAGRALLKAWDAGRGTGYEEFKTTCRNAVKNRWVFSHKGVRDPPAPIGDNFVQ